MHYLLFVSLVLCFLFFPINGNDKDNVERKPDRDDDNNETEEAKKGRFFFAYYSNTEHTVIATTTQVLIATCFSTANPLVACVGRRRQRFLSNIDIENVDG